MDIAYGKFAKENKDVQFDIPVLLLLGDNDTTGKVNNITKLGPRQLAILCISLNIQRIFPMDTIQNKLI